MLAKWNAKNGGLARTSSAPFPTIDSLFDEALSIFQQPFFGDLALNANWAGARFAPAADITETAEVVQVSLDLPGHDPTSLKVSVEGDTLTVHAERKQERQDQGQSYLRSERSYGVFARSFTFPSTVDAAKCEAKYEHGVLTVTMPKREEAKPKSIEVKVQT
jgi:HSP20 family protein